MVDIVTRVNNVVNGFVWGPFGLALLFCTGLWLSVRTGFFQFRRMGYWLKHTIGAIFTNKDITAHTSKEDMAISQFQSMCTALAGTIGTGNIVGVATAIVSGGPGAIFWMWVMALLGMMTSFAENVLGVYYRRKNEKGEWNGGAMYYLTDGLGAKPGCKAVGRVLAVLFACFCILASFGIGNMSQINSIAGNMNAAFHLPYLATGLALMVVTALIVIGGLKRVAAVTEKLVPLMALFYVAGALIIVVMHAGNIPAALAAIFKGAFNLNAAGGGALGYGISQTITWGFKRGAFSNEAGLGSAVMVNSASNVKEPVHQGMWGVFEVFADTIVVCTLTALVILTTGVVDLESGAVLAGVQDNALVGQAFTAAFGSFGPKFIAVSILLFAYSTTLGWSHYGTKAVEYLFGTAGSRIYKVVFVCMTVVGATMKLGLAWDLSDTFNGLMMIPNLIGVLALSGTVVDITRNYFARRVRGEDIEPMWSAFEEYQKEEEAEAAAEEAELEKFDVSNDSFKTSKRAFHRAMGRFNAVMEFFLCILSVAVISVGGFLIMQGRMDTVDLITFSLYITTFVNPVRKLSTFAELFANGTAGFARFVELMREEPAMQDAPDATTLSRVEGRIDVDHVSFAYQDDMAVLHDVDLHIRPGETIAVVGPSGGGKSTLCQLIPRFYDVTDGAVRIDGHDVRQVTQESLRQNVGVVQQDVFLFAASILENIRYGKPGASEEEVARAAKLAEIYDDIVALPEGFNTYVGERGTLLSGGQKQRISIARIFLKDPPVLILDEATSALDSVTEAKLQETFEKLAHGRTTIIIAHRLSTVRNADRIAVIEDGRITELGSHDQLMAKNGAYAELVRTQELIGHGKE